MNSTVQCNIVSADESLFSGSVSMVIATGSLGEMGITPGHAPLLSDLNPGPVRLLIEGGEELNTKTRGNRRPLRILGLYGCG